MPTPITVPTVGSGTLGAGYTSATNTTFLGQVAVAISVVAPLVQAEDPTAYSDDDARKRLADLAIGSPLAYATQSFVYAVVADLTTTSSSSDSAIITRVAAVWSTVAAQYAQ